MALSEAMTVELCNRIKPGANVASFGYPDITASPAVISSALSGRVPAFRKDSAAVCERHGLEPRDIPDAHSFCEALGARLDVYDVVREHGCETLIDLNHEAVLPCTYDFALDVGTLEHCFNIAQAAFNMASCVKLGGFIIHENPFNWGNHGFYGFNPTWYEDFYSQNGFKIVTCKLVGRDGRVADVPTTKRFRFVEFEANVLAVAERLEKKDFVVPIQSKYKHLSR